MKVRTKGLAALVSGAVFAGVLTMGVGGAEAGGPGRSAPDATPCDGDELALAVVGLTTDNKLLCFNEFRASRTTTIGSITGLSVDTRLVGIDFRPANSTLVGLGDKGGIYTINPKTAAAALGPRLNVTLSGTSFGVDFNPTVDRLRIVSNTGQNLRANVADGVTTTDGTLAYVPAPGQPVVAASGIAAAAYTNNDSDPNTATTLFDIDTALDQAVIQAAPNAGVLNPTGKLLADVGSDAGFDIYSHVRAGTTLYSRGLAVLTANGRTGLYRVELLSGTARLVGILPSTVVDVAIPLGQ